MDNRLKFQEKLGGIREIAQKANDRIAMEDVEKYFEDDHLTQEQMDLVCDYLLSQKIVVKGYQKKGGLVKEAAKEAVHYTEEEERYLKMYQEELASIKTVEKDKLQDILKKAASGDDLAKSKAIEQYLSRVIEIAEEMYHPEIFLGDMVQEGNVGLVLAMDMLDENEDPKVQIESEIRASIQAMIEEQEDVKQRDRKMVEKVNNLDKGIKELTEDAGSKVTLDELSEYLDMPEEEILDILKLAGEELDEVEVHDHDHDHCHDHE